MLRRAHDATLAKARASIFDRETSLPLEREDIATVDERRLRSQTC